MEIVHGYTAFLDCTGVGGINASIFAPNGRENYLRVPVRLPSQTRFDFIVEEVRDIHDIFGGLRVDMIKLQKHEQVLFSDIVAKYTSVGPRSVVLV